MKYTFLKSIAIAALLLPLIASAQSTVSTVGFPQGALMSADAHRIYMGKSASGITGSPFLFDYWSEGTVTLKNGTVYQGIKLKYDELNDRPLFSEDENQLKTFAEPVTEFTIREKKDGSVVGVIRFKNGFGAVAGNSPDTFYQVLVDGKVKLLKQLSKNISEEAPSGSIIRVKRFVEAPAKLFAATPEMVRLKKDQKSLLPLFKENAMEVETFIHKNKLNLKDEADMIKVFQYHNGL